MFSSIFASYQSLVDSLTTDTQYVTLFTSVIAVWFIIKVMFTGYMVFFGRVEQPIIEILFTLIKYFFIIMVASNYSGYLDLVFKAINGIKDFISGDLNIFETLDTMLLSGGNLAGALSDRGNMVSGTISAAIVWAGTFLACGIPFFIIAINMVILKILALTAPFFICCLMFGWFKGFFQQWLSLVISNILTYLFLGLSLNLSITFFNEQIIAITDKANQSVNLLGTSAITLLICFLSYTLSKMSTEIAKSISQVSIESLGTAKAISSASDVRSGLNKISSTAGVANSETTKNTLNRSRNAFNHAMNKYRARGE